MAIGTWLGLETSRRGVAVHQNALDITGQNLANASTPGYSRQEAVIRTTDPYTNPTLNSSCTPGQFGTGATVDYIRRIKDEYLDNNVRKANTDSGYWEDQIAVLQRAEACFAEPANDGTSKKIVEFFKSWMDLNNNPSDLGVKSAVVELGHTLATLMKANYNQLDSIERSVATISGTTVESGMLVDQVTRINTILTEIGSVTKSIQRVYEAGQQPNDLLDRRDVLLEELSHYGPVQINDGSTKGQPNGALEVKFFGETVFKDDGSEAVVTLEKLSLSYDVVNKEIRLGLSATKSINLTKKEEIPSGNKFGEFGSLLGLENSRQIIMQQKIELNSIAVALRDSIKKSNETINTTNPPLTNPYPETVPTHPDFFVGDLVNGDFGVKDVIRKDPGTNIDGSRARFIAELRDKDIPALKDNTFSDYYSLLVTQVGNGAKSADDMAGNQEAIKRQITNLRDSVSGVQTDEELTKMMQFQSGFQASARMITTINEMLDVIINRMGV
ncbi:flagellar hook-associated protein FlgK [Desulforamulus aeronauticus]|uniref:Flagellar hook-associated protein 1 n=1 Tax=Desulforamulus aeronauticus DSM 10349 TaxID=1121421 RepID=A0A1M6REE6_9FIRM|nr:flagellar hook-associated protein FlgK [Desulforamulus aeronauticus]SHK30738.1 flagellar hook-associated protein 1 FlgK [Desulforamulus aeronauticus DSM 10349]